MQRHSTDSSQANTEESKLLEENQEGCILNNKLRLQYFIEFLIIWISDKNKAWTQVYDKWAFWHPFELMLYWYHSNEIPHKVLSLNNWSLPIFNIKLWLNSWSENSISFSKLRHTYFIIIVEIFYFLLYSFTLNIKKIIKYE